VVLEILHRPLVLLGGCPAVECAEISSFTRSGIGLAGIQTVFSGLEFANHDLASFLRRGRLVPLNSESKACAIPRDLVGGGLEEFQVIHRIPIARVGK
jgi:hypothetical protein